MKEQYKPVLGEPPKEHDRKDAMHIAVIPLEVGCAKVVSGQHVGIKDNKIVNATRANPAVAIVDPFLPLEVKHTVKGGRVWVVMMPYTITDLRHEWSHPAIEDPEVDKVDEEAIVKNLLSAVEKEVRRSGVISRDPEGESRRELERVADHLGVTYDRLMEHAAVAAEDPNYYWVSGGDFEGLCVPDDFWTHWSKVTGRDHCRHDWAGFTSCAC